MAKIMNKEKYIPRIIDTAVERYLTTMGAVCIEGPKWCGKTWTSSFHSNSEFMVGNPDNNFQLSSAMNDDERIDILFLARSSGIDWVAGAEPTFRSRIRLSQ